MHPYFFPLTSLLTVQLKWLLVASTAVAVRPLIRPVRDTRQAYFVSWPSNKNCAFLIDVYVAGGTAATVVRRIFPKQFLHFHRDGHGAITRPRIQRDYTVSSTPRFRSSLAAAASTSEPGRCFWKNIALFLRENEADGPYYHQDGTKQGAISCVQSEDVWM